MANKSLNTFKEQLEHLKLFLDEGFINEERAEAIKLQLVAHAVINPLQNGGNNYNEGGHQGRGAEELWLQQNAERLFPWMLAYHRTKSTIERIDSCCAGADYDDVWEDLKKKYIDKVKADTLTAWEVCIGELMFSDEDIKTKMMRLGMLLFGIRKEERLSVHN